MDMKHLFKNCMELILMLCFLLITGGCSKPNSGKPVTDGQPSLANSYPNDIGIENDPNVLYVEKFDDGMTNILGRYVNVSNTSGMSLDTDVPMGSLGPNSIKMTNNGGQNTGGHLYKSFPEGFDSTVYIRYYVKYPSISNGYVHHQGVWFGGNNPPSDYPNPQAGICGLGNSRLHLAYEPVNNKMGTYLYWSDMQSDPGGNNCWGNDVINGSRSSKNIAWDQWMCVEVMIKLNNPVSACNGELRVWHNGEEVGYWGPGFPKGTMTYGKFTTATNDPPFNGFRWRTDANLKINYIWFLFYDDTSPDNVSHYIKFSHFVMAKKYIGPLKK
jgi:hypothetical protein